MRMIVEAFEETLDKGLQKYGEVVVSLSHGHQWLWKLTSPQPMSEQ